MGLRPHPVRENSAPEHATTKPTTIMSENRNADWAKKLMDLEAEILALPQAQRAEALRAERQRLSPDDFATLSKVVELAQTGPAQPIQEKEFLDWFVRPAGGPEYRVADFFHAGGMATVWRLERREPADDAQWPPVLLCKTPTTQTLAADQAKADADFQVEAKLLREIQHPDVIRVLDIDQPTLRPPAPDGVLARVRHTLAATGRPCFLMDFAPDSVRLYDWMERQRAELPPVQFARQLAAILRTVTEILADLQDRYSLVHGDLSGGNIRQAHDTLAGTQQRGIMQPIDAPYLETLRAKVGGE